MSDLPPVTPPPAEEQPPVVSDPTVVAQPAQPVVEEQTTQTLQAYAIVLIVAAVVIVFLIVGMFIYNRVKKPTIPGSTISSVVGSTVSSGIIPEAYNLYPQTFNLSAAKQSPRAALSQMTGFAQPTIY